MREFKYDEDGYLNWIKENRENGFVINIDIGGTGSYLKLHRARCGTISSTTRGHWTDTSYKKICSLNRKELEDYSKQRFGNQLTYCGSCKPDYEDGSNIIRLKTIQDFHDIKKPENPSKSIIDTVNSVNIEYNSSITNILDEFKAHFSTKESLARVNVMIQVATQTEGWWKTEIIYLLELLRQNNMLKSFEREWSTGKGREKLDFFIDLGKESVVIEIKTAFCDLQKGTMWKLPSYVMGPKDGYILTDILKLSELKALQNVTRYFHLIFAYPSPLKNDWNILLQAISNKSQIQSLKLARLDNSEDGKLSIGWIEVG
ncbi:MAG: hypothetical protein ACE14V_01625 [bacterium]